MNTIMPRLKELERLQLQCTRKLTTISLHKTKHSLLTTTNSRNTDGLLSANRWSYTKTMERNKCQNNSSIKLTLTTYKNWRKSKSMKKKRLNTTPTTLIPVLLPWTQILVNELEMMGSILGNTCERWRIQCQLRTPTSTLKKIHMVWNISEIKQPLYLILSKL